MLKNFIWRFINSLKMDKMRWKGKRLILRLVDWGGGGFWDINIPASVSSASLAEQIAGALFIKNSSFLKEVIQETPDSDKLLLTNRFEPSHIRLCQFCVHRLSY